MEWKESFNEEEIIRMANAIFNANFKKCWEIKEDLVSEGILGIVQAIHNYDRSKGVCLSTYAWNMGRGKMMNYYNKEKESRASYQSLPDCEWIGDDELDVVEKIENKDKFAKIYSIVGKMKEEDRVLAMGMMQGYSLKEIADSFNVTYQAMWVRWKRVRAKIVREYEGKGVNSR